MDMAVETHFLSVLNHKNIIKMRGVGQDKLDKWVMLSKKYDTVFGKIRKGKTKKKKLFIERLNVALSLAEAMMYLHKLKNRTILALTHAAMSNSLTSGLQRSFSPTKDFQTEHTG
eukprot:13979568-Ditylum_brightwellii.AAC.1